MNAKRSPVVPQRRINQTPSVPLQIASRATTVAREGYSIQEASAALGVSESTIKRLIRKGDLHSVKALSRRLIPVTAIANFLAGS